MKALLFAVLVAVAYAQTDSSFVDDSWINQLTGVSFFYHDGHDLLLTVTHDSCYYTRIIDRDNYEKTLLDHKAQVEIFIGTHMSNPDKAHPTTLIEMMNLYEDRLANFHCVDKKIYTLDITKDELNDLSHTGGGSGGQWLSWSSHLVG